MSITGRSYLERGRAVRVVTGFALPSKTNPLPPCPPWLLWYLPPGRDRHPGPPRNVAVLREPSGERVVPPFRGLRKPPASGEET
jgi:hypothetical protein